MLHIIHHLKENFLSFLKMTSVVTFVSPARHTRCTKLMLHICNIWLERVNLFYCISDCNNTDDEDGKDSKYLRSCEVYWCGRGVNELISIVWSVLFILKYIYFYTFKVLDKYHVYLNKGEIFFGEYLLLEED